VLKDPPRLSFLTASHRTYRPHFTPHATASKSDGQGTSIAASPVANASLTFTLAALSLWRHKVIQSSIKLKMDFFPAYKYLIDIFIFLVVFLDSQEAGAKMSSGGRRQDTSRWPGPMPGSRVVFMERRLEPNMRFGPPVPRKDKPRRRRPGPERTGFSAVSSRIPSR